MKRLAGTPNPRSWNGVKLTIEPAGGAGICLSLGAYHSGYGPCERGRNRPTSTNASKSSLVMEKMGHGSQGGSTLIFSIIETEEGDEKEAKSSLA